MSPAVVWLVVGLLGELFTCWNLWDAWCDRRQFRSPAAHGLVWLFLRAHVTIFIGLGLFLWLGLDAVRHGFGGSWTITTLQLIGGELAFTALAIGLRVSRWEIRRLRIVEVIEVEGANDR